MRDRKHDIEKYLRGELTPAEMHALEKEALSDPFLAEALEGVEQAGADNFLYDLHKLNRSVRDRMRRRGRKNSKMIRMWGWTSAVAATLLLLAVSGYLVINLLRDQRAREQARQQTQPTREDPAGARADSQVVAPADSLLALKETDPPALLPKESATTPSRKKLNDAVATTIPGEVPEKEEEEQKQVLIEKRDAASTVEIAAEEKADDGQSKKEEPAGTESIARADVSQSQPPAKEERAKDDDVSKALSGRAAGLEAKRNAPTRHGTPTANNFITGKVTGEDGQELPGVNVVVQGTNIGAVTDSEGKFELNVPVSNSKLLFAFIGFESREVDVRDQKEVNVTLEEDIATLSEVVVTGYSSNNSAADKASSFRIAEPNGGKNDFKKYLSNSVKYPQQAIQYKAEGKVTVRFTVEPTGQLTDFEVVKGIGYGCEEELIRAIQQGPYWKPSTQGDQPVRDKVRVRFRFHLPD